MKNLRRSLLMPALLLAIVSTAVIADIKISALPAGSALGGTEKIPAVQSGATVAITPALLNTYVVNNLSTSVSHGGTGQSTLPIHGLLVGQATAAIASVSAMAADTLLQGQGATADPAAVAVPNCAGALTYSTSTHTFGCGTAANAVTVALKTSDTSRNTTTTQTADPDLQFGTVAAGFYRVTGIIQVGSSTSGIAAGFFTGTNANVTAQSNYQFVCTDGAATAITFSGNTTFITGSGSTIGSFNLAQQTSCQVAGSIRITGAGSTIVFTWAQKTSSATATIVQGGSYLKLEKIG